MMNGESIPLEYTDVSTWNCILQCFGLFQVINTINFGLVGVDSVRTIPCHGSSLHKINGRLRTRQLINGNYDNPWVRHQQSVSWNMKWNDFRLWMSNQVWNYQIDSWNMTWNEIRLWISTEWLFQMQWKWITDCFCELCEQYTFNWYDNRFSTPIFTDFIVTCDSNGRLRSPAALCRLHWTSGPWTRKIQ